jgi:peptide/nickel transport system permease protein
MIENGRPMNVRLWAGLALLILFAVLAVLGPFIAPYSPSFEQPVRFENGQPITSPEPPSGVHWFGKDQQGRDVLSLMLYGLRYTLLFVLIVALIRVAAGAAVGVWTGMSRGSGENQEAAEKPKKSLLSLTGLFGGIPAIVLIVYFLSPIVFNLSFGLSFLIQGLVIAAFGVAPVASTVRARTVGLRQRLSVLAAKTMGATKGWLIRRHILPMLKETLVILFVQDMILVLNLVGQLSVFEIFLGGTEWDEVAAGHSEPFSKSLEWAGLIGQNKTWVIAYPWLVWVPLAAYFVLLLSFFLVAKGLELRWREMYNKHPHV